jgi:hypothetical protein
VSRFVSDSWADAMVDGAINAATAMIKPMTPPLDLIAPPPKA